MTELELAVPPEFEIADVASRIEEAADELGLTLRTRGALGKYRGSTHWHYGQTGKSGTLELTFWPMQRRCWIAVHTGRSAAWVPQAAEALRLNLNDSFLKAAGSHSQTTALSETTQCVR